MTAINIVTRPLSLTEDFFRSRTASGFYRNFQVTATYSQDLSSELTLLYKSLRKTLLDYHILISNIHKDEKLGSCFYQPIPNARLCDLLTFEDAASNLEGKVINESFMKKVNDIIFNLYDDSPLFRLILVGKHDLCVVFEHTIADGVAAEYFHEILLNNLAFVDNSENFEELEANYGTLVDEIMLDSPIFDFAKDKKLLKNSLPPSIDSFLADPEVDYSDNDPNYHDKIIPREYPEKWPGRFLSTTDFTISFKLINFAPEETRAILAKCRQEKVTLTSYIEVINALTLQPVFGDKHYTTHKVAITLRRHLDPELAEESYQSILSDKDYKILGNMAHTGIGENLPPLKEFSWELVKQISANLIKSTSNKKVLNSYLDFKKIAKNLSDNTDFFNASIGQPKTDSVKISNLGFVNLPIHKVNRKEWSINNMVFSQDISPIASEFMLNVISTPIGGMNLVLSYIDSTFEDSQFENFDNFVVQLNKNMLKYISDD